MTLLDASINSYLRVLSFPDHDERELSDLESRLIHLGFHYGETVRITKKAPVFKEPLLVEVRGRMIAMSRDEASLIQVEVLP